MNFTGEMVRMFIIRKNYEHWIRVLSNRTIRDREKLEAIHKALRICKAALGK